MLIPAEIVIANLKFPSLIIAVVLGLFYWVFVIWYEGRKDGFESDKTFDLAFFSLILSGAVYVIIQRVLNYLTIFQPNSVFLNSDAELLIAIICFLASLLPVVIFSTLWKWSRYRLLDIYAVAFSQLLIFISIGKFLIYKDFSFLLLAILLLNFYLAFLRYRGYRFSSGVMFSLFLLFLGACGIILFRRSGYLLFYGILVTISLVTLVFRRKRSMYKRNLPAEFIAILKSKLLKKDKEIRESQQLLVKEDPYLQPDRAMGNSEEMDEAILEDVQKNITDNEMGLMRKIRIQVKRALAAIKVGKYGVCEVCGKPIDKARLQAYPEATTCIDCANKVM